MGLGEKDVGWFLSVHRNGWWMVDGWEKNEKSRTGWKVESGKARNKQSGWSVCPVGQCPQCP